MIQVLRKGGDEMMKPHLTVAELEAHPGVRFLKAMIIGMESALRNFRRDGIFQSDEMPTVPEKDLVDNN